MKTLLNKSGIFKSSFFERYGVEPIRIAVMRTSDDTVTLYEIPPTLILFDCDEHFRVDETHVAARNYNAIHDPDEWFDYTTGYRLPHPKIEHLPHKKKKPVSRYDMSAEELEAMRAYDREYHRKRYAKKHADDPPTARRIARRRRVESPHKEPYKLDSPHSRYAVSEIRERKQRLAELLEADDTRYLSKYEQDELRTLLAIEDERAGFFQQEIAKISDKENRFLELMHKDDLVGLTPEEEEEWNNLN